MISDSKSLYIFSLITFIFILTMTISFHSEKNAEKMRNSKNNKNGNGNESKTYNDFITSIFDANAIGNKDEKGKETLTEQENEYKNEPKKISDIVKNFINEHESYVDYLQFIDNSILTIKEKDDYRKIEFWCEMKETLR